MKRLLFVIPERLGLGLCMVCMLLLLTTHLFGQDEGSIAYLEFTPSSEFNCDTPKVCFDLEIKTNPGDSFELFGVNFRLFFDSLNVVYSSLNCTAEGFYVCSSPALTTAAENVWGLGIPQYMTFNLTGAPVPGLNLVVRDTLQSLAQICFDYSGDIYDAEVLCESIIWDKSQDASHGFQEGSDGVVALEQSPIPNEQMALMTHVTQYNWQYTGQVSGLPNQNDCLDINCTAPCNLMVLNTFELGDGSLNDIIACAQIGDTIFFDPSLAGDTILLELDDVVISKSLVLYSTLEPKLTIGTEAATATIKVPSSVSVEIYNLNIIGGLGGNPAALLNHGNLILNDVGIFRHALDASSVPLIRNTGILTWIGFGTVFN